MSERPKTRVYLNHPITMDARIELMPEQAHHLRNVLRLGPEMPVAGFNPADGEWLCRVDEAKRQRMSLIVERRLRAPETEGDLWLLFAPIKRGRLEWLIEKATELGASALVPVWTRHTQTERLNLARLRAHAVAAAEQCERLSVPALTAPQPLAAALAEWPHERCLIVCDETGGGGPIAEMLHRLGPGPAALLTGPEGGFAESELDSVTKLPFVARVGLGPRVLRADTAAVAALSVYQAIAGDWRRPRFVD